MRLYDREPVDPADFIEPFHTFDRQQRWVDAFFARLALVERGCLLGLEQCTWLQGGRELIEQAEAIADRIGHPDLKRLARIARLKLALQLTRFGMAHEAERRIDAMPGKPPHWLLVLETTARARLAMALGNVSRIRDLYSALLADVPEGSIAHAVALAGLAEATTRLAWQGLADRKEAERLLREALGAQRARQLRQYNSQGIGSIRSAMVLSLLIGPNPETPPSSSHPGMMPFSLEMLLQGDPQDRARAVHLARQFLTPDEAYRSSYVARAHVELQAGSQDQGRFFAREALEDLAYSRRRAHH